MNLSLLKKTILLFLLFAVACNQKPKTVIPSWVPYDESAEIAKNASHESRKMRFKLIQSKIMDKNDIWKNIAPQISDFTEEDYLKLKPLIFEQDIPSIQSSIHSGALTYEALTKWYLYRIVKYENDKDKYLNAIININLDAVSEARKRDNDKSASHHPIFGIPVLLKDNINAAGMATSAGAAAFMNNFASDAFIVQKLKEKGAIILGKTNLSEWANFLSQNCPNGYSAVGGQTLNPYGRKIFDTGGSSSGSAVAMAANYAAAAVGTETSGSILSPSGKNSDAGLKPTVGLLSRGGIVPISGTYDTPGPITRNLIDNAILLSAMTGEDKADPATKNVDGNKNYWEAIKTGTLKGLRFGIIKPLLKDSLYKLSVDRIVQNGGIAIEFEPEQTNLESFTRVLGADMKADLPNYIKQYASEKVSFHSVADIVDFNNKDTLKRIPYGQTLFTGLIKEEISKDDLALLKEKLRKSGTDFFEKPISEYKLDVILSISNRNAGAAAVAQYPCLTVPMGFSKNGEPSTLTFIARPFEEEKLYKIGYAYEIATRFRRAPAE
jgi:amidase